MKKVAILFVVVMMQVCFTSFADSRGIAVTPQTVQKMEVPQIVLDKNQICNVYSIAYSPDGKYIAAGCSNALIRIWNLQTGVLERTLSGHTGAVWSVAYSPDGKILVSGSADKTVKCWDTQKGIVLRTLEGHTGTISFVTFNTNGAYIASGSTDKKIKFWETSTGKLLQTLSGHGSTIAAIAYSASGKFVASGSWDKTIKVYYTLGAAEKETLIGHTDAVFTVKFSPDETQLASGAADKTVRLWNVETGELVRTFSGLAGEVWEVAYSPDGKCIAGADSVGTLKIWDVDTGHEVHNLIGHTTAIRSICYSKDGKYLYSGDFSGIIKVWNVKTGDLVATLLQCNDGEWVSWTPDGFLNGSEGALKELSYTVNGKKYSLDQIKETVFQPAIVSARLTDTEVADLTSSPSLASIVFSTQPTVKMSVMNTDNTSRTDNKQRDVAVQVLVTDTGSGIGRVLIKLNGRTIQVADSVRSKIGETLTFSPGLPLTLRYGKNTLSASVYDGKNIQETSSNTVELNWEGKMDSPRLFVLAAAVDNYSDPDVPKLKNCTADAKSLVDTCTQYAGDLYSNVFVKQLLDGDVTKDGLINEIRNFGKAVRPDDVFVLYLAGHGITYTDGDYYFIPCDYKNRNEKSIPEYGVSKWQLIDALSSIRAENMTIILDTCNSASFNSGKTTALHLKGLDKNAIIDRFAAKAGYDLLAACSSYQVAADDYHGHGVFTWCLMEAIQGAADLNQDGQVSSTELALYVIKEVPIDSYERFGYRQEPQRSLPLFDYPVFGKKNPKDGQSLKTALAISQLAAEQNLTVEEAAERLKTLPQNDVKKTDEKKKPEQKKQPVKDLLNPSLFTFGGYGFVQMATGSYSDMATSAQGLGAVAQRPLSDHPEYTIPFRIQINGISAADNDIENYWNLAFLSGISRNYQFGNSTAIVPEVDAGLWFHMISDDTDDISGMYIDPALQLSVALQYTHGSMKYELAPVLTLLPEQSKLLSLMGFRGGILWQLKK